MLKINQFAIAYPTLASFAKEDPTYTRRSKTGKLSVVRKGKRKKGYGKVVSGIGAYGVGNLAVSGTALGGLAVASKLSPNASSKLLMATLPAAAAAGIYGTVKSYKHFRGDRYKKNK